MQLDHILPRADGGKDGITNYILLCAVCNRKKRHTMTLSGLRIANKQDGWMQDESLAERATSTVRTTADALDDDSTFYPTIEQLIG